MKAEGIAIVASPYQVKETMDRLQGFLEQHGATIYARINQQSEVNKVGQNLLPLQFIMFGNPKAGGPLMIENPIVALDLPLKVIAWQDGDGKVWVAYNEAAYIEARYALNHATDSPLELSKIISKVLAG